MSQYTRPHKHSLAKQHNPQHFSGATQVKHEPQQYIRQRDKKRPKHYIPPVCCCPNYTPALTPLQNIQAKTQNTIGPSWLHTQTDVTRGTLGSIGDSDNLSLRSNQNHILRLPHTANDSRPSCDITRCTVHTLTLSVKHIQETIREFSADHLPLIMIHHLDTPSPQQMKTEETSLT